ncbi:MAG TPA: hypothetical protein VMG60_20490 [Burkholderiaceae bacterium]|nr:hypothetical protein [Burkholderiaceae bacterium]
MASDARADHAWSRVRPPTAALAGLLAAGACSLLLACAGTKPAPEAQNRCPPDRPGCQVVVVFTDVGLGERVARLQGQLSAEQPTASYSFDAAAGETLRLKLEGTAAHVVLTQPDGQSSAGLPGETLLGAKGRYALRLAANTAAEDAYGPFQLELRLIGKP